MSESKRDSDPEVLKNRMLEAHKRGAQIDDLEYDEVTDLLNVALKHVRQHATAGADKVRDLARTIGTTPPPPPKVPA